MTDISNETATPEVEAVQEAPQKVFFGESYNRRRPFLVVSSILRPSKSAKTHVKGWNQNGVNMDRFERPEIVDSVSNRHMREAEVIIDILNRCVVKNRFEKVASDEQVVSHYTQKFAEEITRGLEVWARQRGLAPKGE